jgi:hypothetical protein
MTIDLNTYLTDAGIPLDKTLVIRHTPTEKSLLKRLRELRDRVAQTALPAVAQGNRSRPPGRVYRRSRQKGRQFRS